MSSSPLVGIRNPSRISSTNTYRYNNKRMRGEGELQTQRHTLFRDIGGEPLETDRRRLDSLTGGDQAVGEEELQRDLESKAKS